MRRPVCRAEQQTTLPARVVAQVLCNIWVQVNLSLRGFGFEILYDTRRILIDLLFNQDSSTVIYEMPGFYPEGFRDSHPFCCEQGVQRLLLTGA